MYLSAWTCALRNRVLASALCCVHRYKAVSLLLQRSLLWVFSCSVLLAGCGGGSSSTTNSPPVAVSGVLNTFIDTPVNGTLIASDPDNNVLQFSIVSAATKGIAIVTNTLTGAYTYTPNTGVTGIDVFTYKASDGTNDSNVAPVTVHITTNSPPVAIDDNSYSVNEGTNLTVNANAGILVNDNDPEGISLTAKLAVGPQHAANFSLNADGAFTYTHDGSETPLSDTFTYAANDGTSDSNIATVTITIVPVNDPPLATDDNGLTNEGQPVILNVIANDDGVDDLINPASIVLVSVPANGAAVNNGDGTVTYTPDAGFSGPGALDQFTYKVDDQGGATSNVATVVVRVNALPVVTAMCWTTPQEVALNGTLMATDVEDGSNLSYSLEATSPHTKGVVVIQPNGNFSYTPLLPQPMNPRLRGQDSFSYRVTDTDGGFVVGTETVVIDTKIMPLGDSITRGITDDISVPPNPDEGARISYRRELYNNLLANGYNVDFVGSQSNGLSAAPPIADPNHEGIAGIKDDVLALGDPANPNPDFRKGIYDRLMDNPADVLLLHIGTNGLNNFGDPGATGSQDVATLLDEVDRWEGDTGIPVTVFLATIIDQADNATGAQNPRVATFNSNLLDPAGLIQPRIAAGDKLIMVSGMRDALAYPTDLLSDPLSPWRLHPDATGYSKMATTWFTALDQSGVVPKCPP